MIPPFSCLPSRSGGADPSWRLVACLLSLLGFALVASAHQPGNSSLSLFLGEDGVLRGEYHVTDVDLESQRLMLGDRVARGAAEAGAGLRAEDLPWLRLEVDGGPVPIAVGTPERVFTDERPHTLIPFRVEGLAGDRMTVSLVDFFGFDPRHRVVLNLERAGVSQVGLVTRDSTDWTVSLAGPGAWHQFLVFTWEGVWHIWIGIDHILFLIALLLPSVLRREAEGWRPVADFGEAMRTVIKVVTAFTLAHSVTLSLAALELVSLPSKWVESVIALSVVLAALNNIVPVVRGRTWLVALGFGFIHGFGFANVLADLQLPAGTLALALFSFNVGVELGQVVIVLVVFPVIFLFCRRPFYLPMVLHLGSAVIALVAAGWVFDRVFELELMPF
jgi:hypothetical protein